MSVALNGLAVSRQKQSLDILGHHGSGPALSLHSVGRQNSTTGSELLHFKGGARSKHFLAIRRIEPLASHRTLLCNRIGVRIRAEDVIARYDSIFYYRTERQPNVQLTFETLYVLKRERFRPLPSLAEGYLHTNRGSLDLTRRKRRL